MSMPISISQVTISTPPPSPPPSSSERHLQMAPALKEKTLKVSLWHFIWNWADASSFDKMCDTSFYTVSDFPKSVYCQSECDLLMDGLLHFQLKPHNANPATRRAIFSLATWQIADIHKNCANTCNCPKIFVQIRSIVRKYLCKYVQLCANMKQAGILRSHTFSQTLQGDWKTMKKQHGSLWDGIEKNGFTKTMKKQHKNLWDGIGKKWFHDPE